jgi:hypothetical protein
MKLVPFFLTKRIQTHVGDSDLTIYKLMIFLDKAGKQAWAHGDESDVLSEKEICIDHLEPNGFKAKSIIIDSKKNTALIEVDRDTLKLQDYYNWDEALSMTSKPECWRCFYFFKDKEGDDWWSSKNISEGEIQGLGSVHFLFLDILRLFTKSTYNELAGKK